MGLQQRGVSSSPIPVPSPQVALDRALSSVIKRPQAPARLASLFLEKKKLILRVTRCSPFASHPQPRCSHHLGTCMPTAQHPRHCPPAAPGSSLSLVGLQTFWGASDHRPQVSAQSQPPALGTSPPVPTSGAAPRPPPHVAELCRQGAVKF